jgi:hypothetical protein
MYLGKNGVMKAWKFERIFQSDIHANICILMPWYIVKKITYVNDDDDDNNNSELVDKV